MATRYKTEKEFEPGHGYSKADWDEVSDNPPLTKEEIANAKPFREIFPDMAKAMDSALTKRGRPPVDSPKKPVTIRLDPDVIAKFKATGPGWQSRINELLKQAKV